MNVNETIEFSEKQITDPKAGLSEEIFLFISRLTTLVNVDLLIKDGNERTLLSWRNDLHEVGWHQSCPVNFIKSHNEIYRRFI